MKKTYYIFRHGETFATRDNTWYWHKLYTAPILDEGRPTILRMAEHLKTLPCDFAVRSPLLRCQQTAKIVEDVTGYTFSVDRRIREYGLELPWGFKRRISSFIREMENNDKEHIVICTHAGSIVLLTQYLSEGTIHMRKRLSAPLPGVLTIIKDKKVKTINFNDAPLVKTILPE